MEKDKILKQVRELIRNNALTRSELLATYDDANAIKSARTDNTFVFYYIGGAVIFLGVSILVGEHWKELSVLGKLLASLGIAVVVYGTAIYINQKTPYKKLADSFFFISALLSPLGFYILFQQAGIHFANPSLAALVSCVVFIVYLELYFLFRRTIFVLFSIIFGSWFFYAFTTYLAAGTIYSIVAHVLEYKTLLVGLAYILLGYYFSKQEKKDLFVLTPWLYGVGSVFFLLSSFLLTGWQPYQSIAWEIIYPFILFAFIYGSTKLKAKSFLAFGSVFLIAYIMKITYEYFENSFGWPLTVIILGFCIIGIGFLGFRFNKKYFAR